MLFEKQYILTETGDGNQIPHGDQNRSYTYYDYELRIGSRRNTNTR